MTEDGLQSVASSAATKRTWRRRVLDRRPPSPEAGALASTAQAPAGPAGGATASEELDVLRQLRAEIQGLQVLLQRIREGQATLLTYAPYVEENGAEIDLMIGDIVAWPTRRVVQADDVRFLQNQWQALSCSPVIVRPGEPMLAEEQVKELAMCDLLCSQMVTRIGNCTIPARLNAWLVAGSNGHFLPFHDLFMDEMPRLEDRQRLLRLLASAPGMIHGGIVEPKSGLILPFHHRKRTRVMMCLFLLFLYMTATLGIWKLGASGWQEVPPVQPVFCWLLVVLGFLTHYAIERGKTGDGGGYAAIPLGRPTCVIDARAGAILLKGVLMLIGFFALVLLYETPGVLDFFLVGYGLDSFIGIVSTTLERRGSTRGAELQNALSST
jgi:hypothetical protein